MNTTATWSMLLLLLLLRQQQQLQVSMNAANKEKRD